MKRVVVALALAAFLPACAEHPALTVGIGGGSVGLVSCEIQGGSQASCGIITAAVAIGLGGLAWLVTELADTNAHELPSDDEILPDGAVRVHTHTELPPVPLDAGAGSGAAGSGAAGSGAAGSGASGGSATAPSDAGVLPGDAAPAAVPADAGLVDATAS